MGRRGVEEPGDAQMREVELPHSSWEVGEQDGPVRREVDGAKGGDQGECAPTKHAPGPGPGKRVTGAEAHTASRKAKEAGKVHVAPSPHQSRNSADGVLRNKARRRSQERMIGVNVVRVRKGP